MSILCKTVPTDRSRNRDYSGSAREQPRQSQLGHADTHFERHFFGYVPNDDRYAKHARPLSGTPAALSCDELEAAGNPANHKGLHDAAGMDGAGKLVQRFFTKARAGLIGARINQINV